MLNKDIIKGILLDYGGTIDTNGIHWAIVLWDSYKQLKIPVTFEQFKEAYVYAERALALNPYIKPEYKFYDVLFIKAQIQIENLIEKSYLDVKATDENYPEQIAKLCYEFTNNVIKQSKDTLDYLAAKYPIILVSNFYGNIHSVLKDFGILNYFNDIIESAVVGVRKPDPAIWSLGVKAMGFNPDENVVIGDSYDKDIVSGKKAGCQTIWLDVSGWEKLEDVSQADKIITNFTALKNII